MKKLVSVTVLAAVLAAAGCSQPSASAGPNGGDLVSIKGGTAYAELLANADSGEVMVHTWDKDLKSPQPVEKEPITIGGGDKSVELMPHPVNTDPSGQCSRFYGQADWVRGGGIQNGWMHGGGAGEHRTFDWSRCWQAGRSHGHMWQEMGQHRHMGSRHGPGHYGGEAGK